MFMEVNESYSTQTCSSCGCISHNSPKGLTGLNKRNWTCSECGVEHDRDINSALNILALGHKSLAVGITKFFSDDANDHLSPKLSVVRNVHKKQTKRMG
jgi:transposase